MKKVEQDYINKISNFFSDAVTKESSFQVSCQINLVGSGFSGSTIMQVSNDLENWTDLPDSEITFVGDADSNFYDVQSASSYIRIKFVITGGTADFNTDWLLL